MTTTLAAAAHAVADVIDAYNLDFVGNGGGWHVLYAERPGRAGEGSPQRRVATAKVRAALDIVTGELRSIGETVTGEELSDRTRRALHAGDLHLSQHWAIYATPLSGPVRAAAWHLEAAYDAALAGDEAQCAAHLAETMTELGQVRA